mgnify:CR=1 FL=1
MQNLSDLEQKSLNAIHQAQALDDLEDKRVTFLGKSGEITGLLKQLGSLPPEERKEFGQEVNKLKQKVQAALEERKEELEAAALNEKLAAETVDVTLPAAPYALGKMHPISYTMEEVETILKSLGFDPATGPEIETGFHNFTALNIPEDHPARQEHDTFYLPPDKDGKERVLRTHTSPVQIRVMENHRPPMRIQAIGQVYRCDSDLTHTPQFQQVEGLAIGKDLTFGHLKGTLQTFLNRFFEREITMRLRPSYFPFTEPSTEVDIECIFCGGDGCRVCSHTGWLEVLGAGMVHPNVLKHGGIDPTQWQGFAFGAGIGRLAMLKYGINDLRLFFESYQSFLRHFGKPAAQKP